MRFRIQIMRILKNIEVKLIVTCNSCRILNCENVLEKCKPELYYSLDDSTDFCTVYVILLLMLRVKFINPLKICRHCKGFTQLIKHHQNALSKKVADQFQCFSIELE